MEVLSKIMIYCSLFFVIGNQPIIAVRDREKVIVLFTGIDRYQKASLSIGEII